MAQSSEFLNANPQLNPQQYMNVNMLHPQQQIPNYAMQGQINQNAGNNFQFPQAPQGMFYSSPSVSSWYPQDTYPMVSSLPITPVLEDDSMYRKQPSTIHD